MLSPTIFLTLFSTSACLKPINIAVILPFHIRWEWSAAKLSLDYWNANNLRIFAYCLDFIVFHRAAALEWTFHIVESWIPPIKMNYHFTLSPRWCLYDHQRPNKSFLDLVFIFPTPDHHHLLQVSDKNKLNFSFH